MGEDVYATTREPPGVERGALVAWGWAGRGFSPRSSRGWLDSDFFGLVLERREIAEGVGVNGGRGFSGESEVVEVDDGFWRLDFGRGVWGGFRGGIVVMVVDSGGAGGASSLLSLSGAVVVADVDVPLRFFLVGAGSLVFDFDFEAVDFFVVLVTAGFGILASCVIDAAAWFVEIRAERRTADVMIEERSNTNDGF